MLSRPADLPPNLIDRIALRLAPPTLLERQAILEGPVTPDAFGQAFAQLPALHAVEVREAANPVELGEAARVLFWNAERLKYLDASLAMLAAQQADVLVLCEVDVGMARSGNRHTICDLASAFDAGFVFGVEFVELGLGDLREQREFAQRINSAGLHGAGFVARAPLRRPALARLECSGRWFDGAFHERRVGGRIAMLAEIELAGSPVTLVSAHYESHTDPADRLLQTRVMLDAIDARAQGQPVLIGGDFNTSTFGLSQRQDTAAVRRALAENPRRLVEPPPYEPMFELLAEHGYDWSRCNALFSPTQRTRPDGAPPPPLGKIDWLFSRGLCCADAAVVPAVDGNGVAISDHEALVVAIARA